MELIKQNSNSDLDSSTDYLKSMMLKLLDKAKKKGVTDAAVSINNDQGFSVDLRMNEIETLSFGEDKSMSLTVYYGHRKGTAGSTDTSEKAMDALVEAASDIARLSAEDPCFGLADKELLTNEFTSIDLYHPWQISPEQAILKAQECEALALAKDKRIVNSDGVSLSDSVHHYGYANSRGALGIVHSSHQMMSCSLIAKEGEDMQRDYAYTTSRRGSDLKTIDELASLAAERVTSRLAARKIKTQKAPVIFSNRVSAGLMSHFVSAINGNNLYRGNSFLRDCLSKQVCSAFLNIREQPHLDLALGSSAFDGEGVPTRNNQFVVDGVLSQYALGSYAARRMGMQSTANAGGVHNLTVEANIDDLSAMVKEIKQGLLVTELMGQGINILTGDYSRGASGFWIENGEIQFPVDGVTVAGNLQQMFKSIIAVGRDIDSSMATRCGAVWLEEMTIGGI